MGRIIVLACLTSLLCLVVSEARTPTAEKCSEGNYCVLGLKCCGLRHCCPSRPALTCCYQMFGPPICCKYHSHSNMNSQHLFHQRTAVTHMKKSYFSED
uniref:Cysteine rich secreted protein n=1 Tax=Riptortus pedestris TaxID=329032 RepID=R4WD78_RIPPE|nr:cysteine rich secreted protein [Riptortus pedestris]